MVDGPSLRRNTSFILFIGVLFLAIVASLLACLRSKE